MNDRLRNRLAFELFAIIHTCPRFIIALWQRIRLHQLLRHSYKHVLLWREILSEAHIKEERMRNGMAVLRMIPLTSKETYMGRMVEEYVDGGHKFTPRLASTSGTTGKPFRVFLPSISKNCIEFNAYRFLAWREKTIATTKIAIIKRALYTYPFRLGLNYADFRENPEKIYRELAGFEPDVVVAYPSVLLDIALMIKNNPTLPKLKPQFILSMGELLTPTTRSFVSEQLHSEIYDRYALEEIGVVGTECSRHDGFHINSESIIAEITDEAGASVPEGKRGKVVLTNLINYNMPLIRYDTGDYGMLSLKLCPCGLATPRLWLEGRSSTSLTFGNRRMYRYEFVDLDTLMHSILQYQVVKRADNDLLIRVVPGPAWEETARAKIIEGARHFLDQHIHISVEVARKISRASSGKSNLMVDESDATR